MYWIISYWELIQLLFLKQYKRSSLKLSSHIIENFSNLSLVEALRWFNVIVEHFLLFDCRVNELVSFVRFKTDILFWKTIARLQRSSNFSHQTCFCLSLIDPSHGWNYVCTSQIDQIRFVVKRSVLLNIYICRYVMGIYL